MAQQKPPETPAGPPGGGRHRPPPEADETRNTANARLGFRVVVTALPFFSAMRITIELDDQLLRRATRKAAEAGTTLSVLVERALRAHLGLRSEIGARPGSDAQPTLAATFGTAPEAAFPGRDEWDRS